MEEEVQVISSNISRFNNSSKNNLYDLLHITPAEPVVQHEVQKISCEFKPNNGKSYIPKKNSYKAKVKTVRDIRIQFEKDEYEWLNDDLEKQQRTLLKKIRSGQANHEETMTLGNKLLKLNKPVTRDTWQMLMNINPEGHAFPVQFIKWNGKRIKVNGSKGGSNKYIHRFDLHTQKSQMRKLSSNLPTETSYKKRSLLQQSLVVKFKPGPKRCKTILDQSHQKHNFGMIELVKLPKIALEITPKPGIILDPNVRLILQSLRSSDGQISTKMAEFAVSTVTSKHEVPEQSNSLTFDLNYEYGQREILMRRDIDSSNFCGDKHEYNVNTTNYKATDDTEVKIEIETILDNIMQAVEISVNEHNMYTGKDEPREIPTENNSDNAPFPKEKQKMTKKRYCELNRLDVTVITLPENTETELFKKCPKSHCSLGCVCSSLHYKHNLSLHCGRIDCMFKCKCDYSNYCIAGQIENKCPELISGLLNLESKLNSTMAKEEQKFHQTVIVTEDRSVLLKSQNRNAKATKRCNFDNDNVMSLKNHKEVQGFSVIASKINCDNVEPWCMVHNLYKCFCKGIFTEKAILNQDIDVSLNNTNNKELHECELNKDDTDNFDSLFCSDLSNSYDASDFEFNDKNSCARVNPFKRKKYSNRYYANLNNKIMLMERNDKSLDQRLRGILGIENDDKPNSQELDEDDSGKKNEKCSENLMSEQKNANTNRNRDVYFETEDNSVKRIKNLHDSCISEEENAVQGNKEKEDDILINNNIKIAKNHLEPQFKSKLVAWLEFSYKQYKQNMERGKTKIALVPPKAGKVALYPWEFILSRYKEKKNIFLVSQQTPFRMYMAVNTNDQFFKNCTNINNIRFADLHKYPVTVKNLLTNVTDIVDNFCILLGMPHCWEIVGSVTKVDNGINKSISNDGDTNPKNCSIISSETGEDNEQFCFSDDNDNQETDVSETDSSKWFIMTLENDFSEIQFHKRGFFVKFESIVKAIHVARASNKTVRLSSKKCASKNSEAQFGIYAIPNSNEYCVFVGPYEKYESLGIKTVNNCNYNVDNERTRGIWITTKKVDNLKVIDNPWSFMPSTNCLNKMLPLQDEYIAISPANSETINNVPETSNMLETCNASETSNANEISKTSKKSIASETSNAAESNGNDEILPTSGVSLVPRQKSFLKKNLDPKNIERCCVVKRNIMPSESPISSKTKKLFLDKRKPDCVKPVAEIAPQIKIASVHSLTEVPPGTPISRIGGMLILKPEQINERLKSIIPTASNNIGESSELEINRDIENFLANSATCSAPNDDILIVSDDEDDQTLIEEIFIQCKNIESIGWIPGKRNSENKISFEFPGFKFTNYYAEEEVFLKINQVLARKIYIPPHIRLEWGIVETRKDVRSQMLRSEDLTPDMVLTKRGLKHKNDLLIGTIQNKKVIMPLLQSTEKDKGMSLEQFEEKSDVLEEHGENLLNKTVDKRSEILASLSTASADLRSEIAERLKKIIGDNQDSQVYVPI